jgi:hypothetical protein
MLSDALNIARQIEGNHQAAYDRCYRTLRTYPLSVVRVVDQELAAVCRIFQRINQSGKGPLTLTSDADPEEAFRM